MLQMNTIYMNTQTLCYINIRVVQNGYRLLALYKPHTRKPQRTHTRFYLQTDRHITCRTADLSTKLYVTAALLFPVYDKTNDNVQSACSASDTNPKPKLNVSDDGRFWSVAETPIRINERTLCLEICLGWEQQACEPHLAHHPVRLNSLL